MHHRNTALVLIDLQKESDFGLRGLNTVVANAERLLRESRARGIPVIYTRQINRADGVGLSLDEPVDEQGRPQLYCAGTGDEEIIDAIAPEAGDIIIDKQRWSAFHATNLDLTLRSLGIEHVIIGGLVTDGCLMTSVFDAYFRDYRVHLVKDMCATSNEGAHMAAILMMANWVYGIEIYDTGEVLKRLQGEPSRHWRSPGVDTMQFTPETMRQVFAELDRPR